MTTFVDRLHRRGATDGAADPESHVGTTTAGVWALLSLAIALFALAPLALPDGYSWVDHGISEAAAQGIDGAWVARAGFIAFGLAVLWLVMLDPPAWTRMTRLAHLLFGVSMLGVAAYSARPWDEAAPYVDSEDVLHSVFATGMGFMFVIGVALLLWERKGQTLVEAAPDWVAVAYAAVTPLFIDADGWGIAQRVMFVIAALWYSREALRARPTVDPTASAPEHLVRVVGVGRHVGQG